MTRKHLKAASHALVCALSGAPGGDRDEACASAGIAAIQDSVDF